MAMEKNDSISRKYSNGYFLLLILLVMVFLTSFLGNHLLSKRYQNTLDNLLSINRLFITVESTNSTIYDCYLYLRYDTWSELEKQFEETGIQAAIVREELDRKYSRNVTDCVFMVEAYLDQCRILKGLLYSYEEHQINSTEMAVGMEQLYDETQKLYSYINISFKDIYSEKLQEAENLQLEIRKVTCFIQALQVILLLFAVLISIIYHERVLSGITKAIERMTDFVEKIKENPGSKERLHLKSRDELAIFSDTLNDLLDMIEKQMRELEESGFIKEQLKQVEIENLRMYNDLKTSQLRLLQSRINPHFLFNTLNSITSYARMGDTEKTVELMEETAEYLRYNLEKLTKAVTLKEEIENVKSYVMIQKIRFDTRFSFGFNIEKVCENQIMPCMILQPLVENSIRHGLHNVSKGGRVAIRVYKQESRICIEVEDNGKGFDSQVLKQFRDHLKDPEYGKQIGLKNIYMRLKLFYSDDLKFHISSIPGCTEVYISMPEHSGEI
jgi:two-component system sensor histidine kinase YesM